MQVFRSRLSDLSTDPEGRRWLYVPYDQLSGDFGPLAREEPRELGIVLIETSWKPKRRPYHRQKLALILANQREFALEQAGRGVAVDYVTSSRPYSEVLKSAMAGRSGWRVMEPAERELRADLEPLLVRSEVEVLAHEGWLTTREQFDASRDKAGHYRMDAFYRRARRDTGLLMEDGKPVGGKFSFDADNRRPWKGEPPPPSPPRFEVDDIKREVGDLIEERFASHPGILDLEHLPSTLDDAERLWAWAKQECLEFFGPYEDAMSRHSTGLFHTRTSALFNLHRLLPRRALEVLDLDVPLACREGFLRQVLGWREFVRWIHLETDGFRRLPAKGGNDDRQTRAREGLELDDGATPSHLEADRPLPPAYWGTESGLACLDQVVGEVWRESYSHHITRLMVLANIATLLDVSPRELTDWFWVAYTDAYDWVVEPNVLGMGTFSVGELMTTKPYVSGSNYIGKMSDYCETCSFHPQRNCPLASLYWAFLDRHHENLKDNRRLILPLRNLDRRQPEKKEHDREIFRWVTETLEAGERLRPEDRPLG